MKTPHIAAYGLVIVALGALSASVSGQDGEAWRSHFAAGEEARQAGDVEAYAESMAAAVRAMPPGRLNRPFVQYHAARAAAMLGRDDEAVAWLEQAWQEDIEALMISFAAHDPAFEAVAGDEGFQAVMGRPAEMELGLRELADDVYLVEGAGANIVAVVDGNGALLVDTGYGPAVPALRNALGRVGVGDVRRVVLTHAHEDHMGGTSELGVDAVIMAHPGTATAMSQPFVFMEGVELPPKPVSALPDVQVAEDTTFLFGTHEVRLVPTVAHTAGDLTVHLPAARVVHFGDTYLGGNPMMFPGNEDPDAFLDRMEALLDAMHPETVVIGGHDEPTDLAAVREQIRASRETMAFVRDALERDLSLEESAAEGADRFPAPWIAFFYRLFNQEPGL
ncbi:MAG: MBL fold metallo-hydrolase [Longimicrobiales bacterium]|nr:MBL fold metallo-hydrolase [Longimicrobiales bacterium]